MLLAKKSSKSQMESEPVLQEFNKATSFIGETFGAYEQERREMKKKKNRMEKCLKQMKELKS